MRVLNFPDLDRYGRVTSVTVVNGGQYFNDVPVLQVVDAPTVVRVPSWDVLFLVVLLIP